MSGLICSSSSDWPEGEQIMERSVGDGEVSRDELGEGEKNAGVDCSLPSLESV